MTPARDSADPAAGVAAHRDAAADRRDESALRRDRAAAGQDGTRASADARAEDRDTAGTGRDHGSDARDGTAQVRDQRAAGADRAANLRDGAAQVRDETAQRADSRVAQVAAGAPFDPVLSTVLDRAQHSRTQAASDRAAAARDRRSAVAERTQADGLRHAAALDRAAAADDRAAAHEDLLASTERRELSAGDRRDGAQDRQMAALDRRAAGDDRHESARELRAATLDALTGAHLRGPGLVELGREIARHARSGAPLALVFVDVDELKTVNDIGGHAAGDRLLRAVSDAIRAAVRPYDLLVRIGGDEFVCALPGMGTQEATTRMSAVNTALRAGPERASVTVGVAALEPGDSIATLLHRADTALYLQRTDRRPRPRAARRGTDAGGARTPALPARPQARADSMTLATSALPPAR